MEFIELISRWKEFGWVGVLVITVLMLGKRVLDWILNWLGIDITRAHSREDELRKQLDSQDLRIDRCEGRLNRMEEVYRVTHSIAHAAASGIEAECEKTPIIAANILFFVGQLRTIQALEQIWQKDDARRDTLAISSSSSAHKE